MPLTPGDREIARELKERLAGLGKLISVSIFGPRLRGDASRDMDVWIVFAAVDGTLQEKVDAACIAVGFESGVTFCPLLSSRDEASSPDAPPIIQKIRAEGVEI